MATTNGEHLKAHVGGDNMIADECMKRPSFTEQLITERNYTIKRLADIQKMLEKLDKDFAFRDSIEQYRDFTGIGY